MEAETAMQLPAWIQAGGVVAFAAAVWMEQRTMRNALASIQQTMSAILEHVRKVETERERREHGG